MKDIISIFLNDLRNIAKNLVVFVVVIGIAVLPALYAWFNIAANWDPYSNTGDIPFAVCSNDLGYSYSVLSIDAGEQIIENLEKNDRMGWCFVEKEEDALEGVRNGTYYAAVIIPEDFSENLFSVLNGKFKQAELQYYINEKKNAIAPKITDKGVQTIQESVNSAYVGTIAKVLATALKLTSGTVDGSVDTVMDNVIDRLEDIKNKVDDMKTTVTAMTDALDKVDEVIISNKEILPTIQEALNNGSDKVTEFKGSVANIKTVTANISDSIDGLITSSESMVNSVNEQLSDAVAKIESDTSSAADKFSKVTALNEKIISIDNQIVAILTSLQDTFGIDLSPVINRVEAITTRQTNIKNTVESAADSLKKTGQIPSQLLSQLNGLINGADEGLQSASAAFKNVKGKIDSAVDNTMASMDKVSDFLKGLGQDVPDYGVVFDNASATIQNIKLSVEGLNSYIDNAKTVVDNIISKVKLLEDDSTITDFITPVVKDPKALGEFISSPASINSERLFPVENYGSGMTPFYTSLGFWVGGIILVAVARTDLTRHEMRRLESPNSSKMFFGRYLIFFMLGQIQAWIIALGDLFFLKVQCENPVLFIVASLISSFVYSLIIYSLTITFSVIGKALAVVILVIQIAGSGGTFPIEVLPGAFKAMSPYLPFKYGINALREAVAGADPNAFWFNILILLAYVPLALLLGLLLRKPCIKAMNFFNQRIEQSDLII